MKLSEIQPPVLVEDGDVPIYDWSHVLPAGLQSAYRISLRDATSWTHGLWVKLIDRADEDYVGKMDVDIHRRHRRAEKCVEISFVELDPEVRGLGMGKALYIAVLAHSYQFHEVRTVTGTMHSTAANGVHRALGRDFGWYGYEPKAYRRLQVKDFDNAYGPFRYELTA